MAASQTALLIYLSENHCPIEISTNSQ